MIYTYECQKCGAVEEAVRKVASRNRSPRHACGKMALTITGTHRVVGSFEPYRAVGLPGRPYIKTRAEHKAQLRRHGREEVGSDKSMAPEMEATDAEWSKNQNEKRAGIMREIEREQELVASLSR